MSVREISWLERLSRNFVEKRLWHIPLQLRTMFCSRGRTFQHLFQGRWGATLGERCRDGIGKGDVGFAQLGF